MTVDIPALTDAWKQVNRISHVAAAPITNDAELAEATEMLEQVFAEIGEAPDHPLDGFARTLLQRVTAYEDEHHPIPDADAADVLAFLMNQRGLTQRQLTDGTGINQATISQVLNRKRGLTVEQIRALSDFFRVQASVFL